MLKRWLTYCILLFLVAVLYILLEDHLSLFIFLSFLLLPVFSLIARLLTGISVRGTPGTPGIAARFNTQESTKDAPVKLIVDVHNRPRLAFSPLMVRLRLENETTGSGRDIRLRLTAGRGKQTVEYALTSDQCGRLTCRIVEVRLYDYLGLFWFRRKKQVWEESHVLVQPNIYQFDMDVEDTTIEDMESNEFSKIRPGDDPSEIFDIRAYREGDRMSRIHWKLSGKVGRLMVKEGGHPISSGVLILFDIPVASGAADGVVEALASISFSLVESGLPHKVRWYDSLHKHMRREQLAGPEPFHTFLREVLICGRPEREPVALLDYIQDHVRDAHVIYVGSNIPADSINLLHNRLPESRLSIFDICGEGAEAPNVSPGGSSVGIFTLRPGEIAQGLDGAIL